MFVHTPCGDQFSRNYFVGPAGTVPALPPPRAKQSPPPDPSNFPAWGNPNPMKCVFTWTHFSLVQHAGSSYNKYSSTDALRAQYTYSTSSSHLLGRPTIRPVTLSFRKQLRSCSRCHLKTLNKGRKTKNKQTNKNAHTSTFSSIQIFWGIWIYQEFNQE